MMKNNDMRKPLLKGSQSDEEVKPSGLPEAPVQPLIQQKNSSLRELPKYLQGQIQPPKFEDMPVHLKVSLQQTQPVSKVSSFGEIMIPHEQSVQSFPQAFEHIHPLNNSYIYPQLPEVQIQPPAYADYVHIAQPVKDQPIKILSDDHILYIKLIAIIDRMDGPTYDTVVKYMKNRGVWFAENWASEACLNKITYEPKFKAFATGLVAQLWDIYHGEPKLLPNNPVRQRKGPAE